MNDSEIDDNNINSEEEDEEEKAEVGIEFYWAKGWLWKFYWR